MEGRSHRLQDYRGKVVLVNFWATWCAPCVEEMPSMERLRRALAARPFAVLAVNLGESPEAIAAFLARVPVGFAVLRDADGTAARAWGARYLPASYLVDGEGRVRYAVTGALDWSGAHARARIEELLDAVPRGTLERARARPLPSPSPPPASLRAAR